MCILSHAAVSVAQTHLYVSPSANGTRQLTVYENAVNTPTHNAMILPIPHPASVEFHNMSDHPEFFHHLERQFHRIVYPLRASIGGRSPLPVATVGSYRVTVVPTAADFSLIDSAEFSIPASVQAHLAARYGPHGYGFLVCRLKKGSHRYHPFAYSHAVQEPGHLFVPTYHLHDGRPSAFAYWEHTIYSPLPPLDSTDEDGAVFRPHETNLWAAIPEAYRWAAAVPLSRWSKQDLWENDDLYVPFSRP